MSVLRLALVAVVANGSRVLPKGPRDSTQAQIDLYEKETFGAAAASEAAIPDVVELLDGKAFRESIHKCCPSIANISGAEMLKRFQKEMETIEIISNINSGGLMFGGEYPETDLASVVANEYLASEWEALFDGSVDVENDKCDTYHFLENKAEIALYNFPKFPNTHCLPKHFSDAVNRSVYTMLNSLRIDAGNTDFGDIAFVMKRKDFALNRSIISPFDTGIYEMNCLNKTGQRSTGSFQINCSAWSPPYIHASLTDFVHMIPISSFYYSASDWLAVQISRLLADDPYHWGSIPIPVSNIITYWEALPLRHAYFDPLDGYDSAIRFVIASFQTLFGNSKAGTVLRQFCIDHNFILVWAHGTSQQSIDPTLSLQERKLRLLTSPKKNQDQLDALNGRFLDPYVLQYSHVSANVSHLVSTSAALNITETAWQRAAHIRHNITDNDIAWRLAWRFEFYRIVDALPPEARIQPLRADDCPDVDDCIGTTFADRRCICIVNE